MSKKNKPAAQQTVTSKTEIPPWLEQPMQSAVGAAGDLYGQGGPGYYPGQTVVPFSGQTQESMGMTEDLARGGVPGMAEAQQNYTGLLGGDYLYGGEGFNAAIDAAQRQIQPRIASAFGRAGRNESGLADVAMAREIGDVFAGQYGQERNRQMQGLGMAPMMQALAYDPAQRLGAVGAMQEAQTGAEQADARARYEHEAYRPQSDLDAYIQRIQGIAPFGGGTQTQTSPLYRNRGAGVLGGALGGLGAAGQLGAMPFFSAGGAGAGLGSFLGPLGMIGGGLLGAF